MTSSKKVRAIFLRIGVKTPEPRSYYQLRVNDQVVRNAVVGAANGTIEVSPGPGAGQNPYPEGSEVFLTAKPNTGFQTGAWSGDCVGKRPCVVTMDGNKDVVVSFEKQKFELTTSVEPTGGGTVSPTGATIFEYGEDAKVSFEPTIGYSFVEWSGACSGTGQCTVHMDQARKVTASFKAKTPNLTVRVEPEQGGTVSPSGTNVYTYGETVVLTAEPAQGYEFSGWSGACSGADECELTMEADGSVLARFNAVAPALPTPTPLPKRKLHVNGLAVTAGQVTVSVPFGTVTLLRLADDDGTFPLGAAVNMQVTPIHSNSKVQWGGVDRETGNLAAVQMTHDRFVVVLISPNEATSPPSTSPTPNLPAESEVANDIPGTALTFDTAVSSVVDVDTEIRDVYALELTAGQEVQFGVDGFRRATLRFTLAAPGSSSFVTGGISKEFELSDSSTPWQHSFAPATSGTYYLEVKATKEGQNYNLTVTPS